MNVDGGECGWCWMRVVVDVDGGGCGCEWCWMWMVKADASGAVDDSALVWCLEYQSAMYRRVATE